MQGPLQKAEGTGSSAQQSAAELLPLVYAELRRLAASRLAQEKPGQTLQPTALVHEAWLRLVRDGRRQWADSRHFFFAAATAMRRILIENARRKARVKHGGLLEQVELSETALASPAKSSELLALDESLGNYLVEAQYFQGTPATVQLDRAGETMLVRLVVKEDAARDPKYLEVFRIFRRKLSKEVFDGKPVEVHLCDQHLQTLQSIPDGE